MTIEFAKKLDAVLSLAKTNGVIGCGLLGMSDEDSELRRNCQYIFRNSDYLDMISGCFELSAAGFDALKEAEGAPFEKKLHIKSVNQTNIHMNNQFNGPTQYVQGDNNGDMNQDNSKKNN